MRKNKQCAFNIFAISLNRSRLGTKRTLSGWLTNRYLLIIRNEENFAEKRTISFNYARIILLVVIFFLLTLAFAIYLVSRVLEAWLDPRHAQMVANRQLLELTIKIDSLQYETDQKGEYIENIRRILEGNDSIYAAVADGSSDIATGTRFSIEPDLQEVDSQFRAEYEENDLGILKFASYESNELSDLYLFQPIEGIVTADFQPANDHFGVDIVAKENEVVKSVAEGIVIFSTWTLDNGYVIGIQHTRGNLISVYKHNSELLKNVGSFVAGGEIIAIIGNTGELTSGPHLHFELWYKGNAINPENYISF